MPWPRTHIGQAGSGQSNTAVCGARVNNNGVEVWGTDGARHWTVNINTTSTLSSAPNSFTSVGNIVYCIAFDGGDQNNTRLAGAEVHWFDLAQTGTPTWQELPGGCVGSNKQLPRVFANSLPKVGNLKFEVLVDAGNNGKGEFLLFYSLGLTRWKLPTNCFIRLDLNQGFPVFFKKLDNNFLARFPMPIPANVPSAWIGTSLYFQAASKDDPGGALFGGGAVSAAMRILLGK